MNESEFHASLPLSPRVSFYEYTILLRFDGIEPENGDPKVIYLLRFGDSKAGEPVFVVEPVGVHEHDILLGTLNFMAEMKRTKPGDTLFQHPNRLYAIAEYLTEEMNGEIFVTNEPAPGPPPPPGVSY